MRLKKIPRSVNTFSATFENGKENHLIRLYNQPEQEFDDAGFIISNLKFIAVNEIRETCNNYIDEYVSEEVFTINRDNIPKKVSFYKYDGEKVNIKW